MPQELGELGLYTQKKLQQFFQQIFTFEGKRLGFGIFLLVLLGGLLCLEFCLFTLISIYTKWGFKEFKNMSWYLNTVMEYCCLEFWMETSEECCIVLMDEETSAPAPQRVIYKKL